jgi:hypothetical protein
MFSTRPLSKVNRYHHKADGDTQKGVGEIKSRPAQVVADTHIDKVPHETIIEKAVVQVTAYPGGKKSQRNMHNFEPCTAEHKDAEYDGERHERHSNQPIGMPGKKSEGCAFIVNHNKTQDAINNRHDGAVAKPLEHDPLGQQVQSESRCGYEPEKHMRRGGR